MEDLNLEQMFVMNVNQANIRIQLDQKSNLQLKKQNQE